MRAMVIALLLAGGTAHGEKFVSDAADALRESPKRMAYVFGAVFCTRAAQRKIIMDAIAREKAYARTSGVVNLDRLNDYKEMLQVLDDDEKPARKWLAAWKGRIKPAACSDKTVKAILACRDEDKCAEDWYRAAIEFVPERPSEVE